MSSSRVPASKNLNLATKTVAKKVTNTPTSPTLERAKKQDSLPTYAVAFKPSARNVPEHMLDSRSSSFSVQKLKVAPKPEIRPPARRSALKARAMGNRLADGTVVDMSYESSDDDDFSDASDSESDSEGMESESDSE